MKNVWVVLGLVSGCAHERDPASADLVSWIHGAYRSFELGAHRELAPIADWLASEAGSDAAWDGLAVTSLTPDEVAGLDLPSDTVLTHHRAIATAIRSAFDPGAHAARHVEPDQTWSDPGSFESYDREILSGDAMTFPNGTGQLRTSNDIVKNGGFGVTIPYTTRRDYRWETLDGQQVLLSRWWLEGTGCSDNGKNCVLQSFGLDVWVPTETGSDRLLVNFVEAVTEADAFISEEARIALIARGNQDLLLANEEALAP